MAQIHTIISFIFLESRSFHKNTVLVASFIRMNGWKNLVMPKAVLQAQLFLKASFGDLTNDTNVCINTRTARIKGGNVKKNGA